jgi:hypothetical protein
MKYPPTNKKEKKRTCGLGQTRSKQRAFQVAITATGFPLKYIYIKKNLQTDSLCIVFYICGLLKGKNKTLSSCPESISVPKIISPEIISPNE